MAECTLGVIQGGIDVKRAGEGSFESNVQAACRTEQVDVQFGLLGAHVTPRRVLMGARVRGHGRVLDAF